MTDQWMFMDDEEIEESRPKRGGGDVFITTLKADTPQALYFLTKPGETKADWVNYRELNTRDGLRVGPDLPSELSYGILVQDYRRIENPKTGLYEYEFDNNLDPITAGKPGEQMWAVGNKNTDKNGLVRVQWRTAINVVDAVTGYHKILKVSNTAKEDLKKYFAVKDEDGDFDITQRPYELLYTGEGFNWSLAIRPIRPGSTIIRDGKSIEIPRQPELPPIIDVREMLIEQREHLNALVASLPTRSGTPVDAGLPKDHAMYDPAMDSSAMAGSSEQDVTKEYVESGMDIYSQAAHEADNGKAKYEAMSPARLRALHAKAGIDVARGTTKDDLVASAASNNL